MTKLPVMKWGTITIFKTILKSSMVIPLALCCLRWRDVLGRGRKRQVECETEKAEHSQREGRRITSSECYTSRRALVMVPWCDNHMHSGVSKLMHTVSYLSRRRMTP